jgi:thiol-disulfide isomerase/thioredoxin
MGTSTPLVTSRKTFSSWVCMLHNLVNADLGKPHFDCLLKNLDDKYRKGCDGCVVEGKVEDLSKHASGGVALGAPLPQQPTSASPKVESAATTANAAKNASGEGGGAPPLLPLAFVRSTISQKGACTIGAANTYRWLQTDTERTSADLTDGKLTVLFFYAVTCHVCHEIHPVLKQLHEDFADRGLNIIAVHQTIFGDIDAKLEARAVDYHAMEGLPYPLLSHQQTARVGETDRVALPNSLFAMSMGRNGFGVPAMAVMKDCNTLWRGMGFQLKHIDAWLRERADELLGPVPPAASSGGGGRAEL